MARPKLYENAAERQAAFRANNHRHDLVVGKDLNQTLDEIAVKLETPKNALINSMLRFALTNHDWKKRGLWIVKK
jgi:hypothetical protein